MTKRELLEKVESEQMYDFIASNYYLLDKEVLKDILLEYIYAFYKLKRGDDYTAKDIATELNDRLQVENADDYL